MKTLNFCNKRSIDFFHLWHARQGNYIKENTDNKDIYERLCIMKIDDLMSKLNDDLTKGKS